jgi:endonuclease/exonuclease/phosphatase family metal-dependent hydrolase
MKSWCVGVTLAALILAISAPAFAVELRMATWNLEWFFDANPSDNSGPGVENSAPDTSEFESRVQAFAQAIEMLDPIVLALQEIENQAVLQALVQALAQRNLTYQIAFVQGTDTATQQDVAFLVKSDLAITFRRLTFTHGGDPQFKDLSKHLALELSVLGEPLTLITVHLRAGGAVQERQRQARTLRDWIQASVSTQNLIILGDFNTGLAFQETTPESEMGIIRGFGTPAPHDDLFDVHSTLGTADRTTHVSGKQFDRMLISPTLHDEAGLRFVQASTHRELAIRGQADQGGGVDYSLPDAEQDLSDHFPLLAVFSDTAAPPGDGTPSVSRAQLLEAMGRIEAQLQDLQQRVEAIIDLIQNLPD